MRKEIPVATETVSYVESLDYELTARKDIIAFMLSNDMKTDTEAFRLYQKELVQYNAQFDQAKKELAAIYLPPEWQGHDVRWSLDYTTQIMTVDKLCDCDGGGTYAQASH